MGDPCLSFNYKAKLDDLMVSQKSFSGAIVRRELADFFIFFTRDRKYAVRRQIMASFSLLLQKLVLVFVELRNAFSALPIHFFASFFW